MQHNATLTAQDIKILSQQDSKTLANWACELNHWKWPQEIPDEEKFCLPLSSMPRRAALIEWIENHIGKKTVLRAHWESQKFDLSEFDEFWRVHYESNDPREAEEYHERRVKKIMERMSLPSLTGHSREYYKKLKDDKERDLGVNLIGSIGFMRCEIFSSAEWINVFNENEKFNNTDEIMKFYGKLFEVVQYENDGDEFRVWLRGKNRMTIL